MSIIKKIKEWGQGTGGHFPQKQIFDPTTKEVKDPKECNIINIVARLIFEETDRVITGQGHSINPTLSASLEKTFIPHLTDPTRKNHQYYMTIDNIEIKSPDGTTHIENRSNEVGVLIAKPIQR